MIVRGSTEEHQYPRFACHERGTFRVWMRSPVALTDDLREWRARASVAVYEASLSGLSVTFLQSNLDRDDGKARDAAELDPLPDADVEVTFKVRGRTLRLPAKLVWFTRDAANGTRAGVRLDMVRASAQDRTWYFSWVEEHTTIVPPPPPREDLGELATMETTVMVPDRVIDGSDPVEPCGLERSRAYCHLLRSLSQGS